MDYLFHIVFILGRAAFRQLTDKTFEKALISLLKMTRQLGFENKNLETACSQILLS